MRTLLVMFLTRKHCLYSVVFWYTIVASQVFADLYAFGWQAEPKEPLPDTIATFGARTAELTSQKSRNDELNLQVDGAVGKSQSDLIYVDGFEAKPSATLIVEASDIDGDALQFSWSVTGGHIESLGDNKARWYFPEGRGVHFAYVLVSDGKGGNEERRITLVTDGLGRHRQAAPRNADIPLPQKPEFLGGIYRGLLNNSLANGDILDGDVVRQVYLPGVSYKFENVDTHQVSSIVETDRYGHLTMPKLPQGDYLPYCTLTPEDPLSFGHCGTGGFRDGVISIATEAETDYRGRIQEGFTIDAHMIFGHVTQVDGKPCGTKNELFAKDTTPTLSIGANLFHLADTTANAYGDYMAPVYFLPDIPWTLVLSCEGSVEQRAIAAGTPNTSQLANVIVANSSPAVESFKASIDSSIAAELAVEPARPSDTYPAADHFLTRKGMDSRRGACEYYRSVGAVTACNSSGEWTEAINFSGWKSRNALPPFQADNDVFSATFINFIDLNLTRRHQATRLDDGTLAYVVCNYVGPDGEDQAAFDGAISGALADRKLVACVAMDYFSAAGVNGGEPFIRFLTFGPTGELLPSINLDGRGEKFMPGVCVACHGGDHYAGPYPADGSGLANIGAHFLPFDIENFHFSSQPDLTAIAQADQIRELNLMILESNPTSAAKKLIENWYIGGGVLPNTAYVPNSWLAQDDVAIEFYNKVIKPNCRTCHVALPEKYNWDEYGNISAGSSRLFITVGRPICGNDDEFARGHSMPNALVTFERFWGTAGTDNDLPALTEQFFDRSAGWCALETWPVWE